jgi:hypothetical protein
MKKWCYICRVVLCRLVCMKSVVSTVILTFERLSLGEAFFVLLPLINRYFRGLKHKLWNFLN